MTLKPDGTVITLMAGLLVLAAVDAGAAVAPLSPEGLQKEASHVIRGQVSEVTSKIQTSRVERAVGIHRDRVYTIKLRVSAIMKGAGMRAGDEIVVEAWRPHVRIPPLPGPQGHGSIPSKGDAVTVYLKGGKGRVFEPILPNGIVIDKHRPGKTPSAKRRAEATDDRDRAAAPSCELRLELRPDGGRRVSIRNTGRAAVTLVMPGDGSDVHWRTPIVGWSFLPAGSKAQHPRQVPPPRGLARCGNINSLRADEVFVLKPGQARDVSKWLQATTLPSKPGQYRVVCYYVNDPAMKWSGLPLGKHDADAMRRVRASTPISLVSNEIVFDFAGK